MKQYRESLQLELKQLEIDYASGWIRSGEYEQDREELIQLISKTDRHPSRGTLADAQDAREFYESNS